MFLAVDLHLQNRGSVQRMEVLTPVGRAESNSVSYFFEEHYSCGAFPEFIHSYVCPRNCRVWCECIMMTNYLGRCSWSVKVTPDTQKLQHLPTLPSSGFVYILCLSHRKRCAKPLFLYRDHGNKQNTIKLKFTLSFCFLDSWSNLGVYSVTCFSPNPRSETFSPDETLAVWKQ